MYVNEKLKLNKFQHVSLPNNSDLWLRSGCALVVPGSSQFTGEEQSAPADLRKTDVFARSMSNQMNELRREAAEARDKAQEDEDES